MKEKKKVVSKSKTRQLLRLKGEKYCDKSCYCKAEEKSKAKEEEKYLLKMANDESRSIKLKDFTASKEQILIMFDAFVSILSQMDALAKNLSSRVAELEQHSSR